MEERIRISRDCDGMEKPEPNSAKVCRLEAGEVLPLRRVDDKHYFKAWSSGRSVYVPKSCAERTEVDYAWERFAEQVGGTYSIEGGSRLGPITTARPAHKVRSSVGDWVITLETVEIGSTQTGQHTETRISAPYVARHPLHFQIYRRTALSDLGKRLLRMQDIEVGHPDFDRDFIVKGDNEASIRRLLANSNVRSLFQTRRELHLRSDGAALAFRKRGVVTNRFLLKAAHDLIDETLHELQRMGFIR